MILWEALHWIQFKLFFTCGYAFDVCTTFFFVGEKFNVLQVWVSYRYHVCVISALNKFPLHWPKNGFGENFELIVHPYIVICQRKKNNDRSCIGVRNICLLSRSDAWRFNKFQWIFLKLYLIKFSTVCFRWFFGQVLYIW